MRAICYSPKGCAVRVRRPRTGIELRSKRVSQFSIVYAYFEPNSSAPNGAVSIRAVRHSRVRDVFLGVREPAADYIVTPATAS
jgi:hypothetical protein